MACYSIFIPKARAEARIALQILGLHELLEPGVNPLGLPATHPEAGRGLLVNFDRPAIPESRAPNNIDPRSQVWMASAPEGDQEAGRYWVGYQKADRPKPSELARRELADGHQTILMDELPWLVPIADWLPKRLTIDKETGEECRIVIDKHREFVAWSNHLHEWFLSAKFDEMLARHRTIRIPQGMPYAAAALAVNYRVNLDIIDALGLVGEYECCDIARIGSGFETLAEILEQKKTQNWDPAILLGLSSN